MQNQKLLKNELGLQRNTIKVVVRVVVVIESQPLQEKLKFLVLLLTTPGIEARKLCHIDMAKCIPP